MKSYRFPRASLSVLSLLFVLGLGVQVSGQTASTVPVGAVTVTIAGSSNGTVYNATAISAPLAGVPLVPSGVSDPLVLPISGAIRGNIDTVSSNSISVSSAGWVAGQLSQVGYPMFVHVKSGTNAGRIFYVVSNTANTLSLNTQGLDLIAKGLKAGDGFEITPGDTLKGLFGTPADGVIGGTAAQYSANAVDKILINDPTNNAIVVCYYNTTNSRWQRVGTSTDQGNMVISPRMGLEYQRISTTPLVITFVGYIPTTALKQEVPTLGSSILASYFPVDTTLKNLKLHEVSGWKKVGQPGITTANCDRVLIKVGPAFLSFYYDITLAYWKRVGTSSIQDGVSVPLGSSYRVMRAGSAGVNDTLAQELPYTL